MTQEIKEYVAELLNKDNSGHGMDHINRVLNLSLKFAEKYTRKCADSSVCHIFEKILRLKDLMITKSGKEEAKDRHNIIVEFLYHLFDEEDVPEWTSYLTKYLNQKNIN